MKSPLIMALCLMLSATAHAAAAVQTLPLVNGIVKKIELQTGKITLAHGDIPNLNMKPMTMPYAVKQPAELKMLHEGDKVKFSADKIKDVYTVVHIEVVK